MNNVFTYAGNNVLVPHHADIPVEFKPRGRMAWVVQRALNGLDPWNPGEDPVETVEFDDPTTFLEIVVENDGVQPIWGIHVGHKARHPQQSPFIRTSGSHTNEFTIELVGTPNQPRLVRAYPGDYIPPLPWQNSARDAVGGMQACLEFWRTHSYILRPGLMQNRGASAEPPSWFTS